MHQNSFVFSTAYFLFLQDPNILDVFIPRVRQTFETKKEAYEFYCDYARLAGFSVWVKRTSKETADWVCNREGFLKTNKENNEPQIEKTSKRVGCPAYAKVKQDKKANQWYFDHVEEAHNHKLHPSPRMVRYMHIHKQRDAALDDLFAIMARNGVAHQAAMNVMSELYGGHQNWPFTEKDVKNMYVPVC